MNHLAIIDAIAIKNLKTFVRDIKSNAIVFILPIVFITVFKLAFGGTNADISFNIGIVSQNDQLTDTYQERLLDIENENEGQMFEIERYDSVDEMKVSIEQNDIDGGVVVQESGIVLIGDTLNPGFNAISGVITQFSNRFYQAETIVSVESVVRQTEDFSGFTYLVPGLIVYGMIMLIPQVTIVLAHEREDYHTFRYFTSQVKGVHIILGYLISHGLIGIIQTSILFATVSLYGYESQVSIIPALIIAIPTTFFCVGVGLLLGGLVSNSEESGNWGTIVTIVLGFMSGAFISVPQVPLLGTVTLADILPTALAADALRQTMQFGRGIESFSTSLMIISGSAFVLIVLGGYLYNKRQLSQVSM